MNHNAYLYILVMFAVTYAIRVLPITLIQKQIKSQFLQSVLYYVPYVTLSVMTFPAIIEATQSPLAGFLALLAGIVAAFFQAGLFKVALLCCSVVFITELILISSGRAPDVGLATSTNSIGEFALRNAVVDLSGLEGFAEVRERFLPELFIPMTYQDGANTATFSVPLFETSSKVSQVLLNDQGTIRAQAVSWESSPQKALLQPYVDTQNNSVSYQSNKMVWSPIWMNIQLQNPGKVTVKKMEIVEVLNGKEVGRLPVKLSKKGQDAYRSRLESNGFATMDAASASASAFENADGTFLYAFDKRYTLQSGDHLVLYLDVVDEQGVRYRSVADFASLIGRQKVDSDWQYEMEAYRSRGLMVLLDPNGQVVYNADPELLYAK